MLEQTRRLRLCTPNESVRSTKRAQLTVNGLLASIFTCLALFASGVTCLEAQICRNDEDCPIGLFCAKWDCDSLEGWMFPCSRCIECSTCLCDKDALTGICPMQRCPGTPVNGLQTVAGTFYSVVSVKEWQDDICVTSFIMQGKSFSQTSFRVSRTSYDFVGNLFPIITTVETVGQTLCAWPDNKDHITGFAEAVQAEAGFAGRLLLTYHSGLPFGTTRTVTLAHKCPEGLTFTFQPIPYILGGYDGEFPNYRYNLFGDVGAGYYLAGSASGARLVVDFHGPAQGDAAISRLSGHYSGTFTYGTTRLGPGAEGHFPGLKCNIDYVFAPSTDGLMSFSKHTYNCFLYTPAVEEPDITTPAPATTPTPVLGNFTNFTMSTPGPARRHGAASLYVDDGQWGLRNIQCGPGTRTDPQNASNCISCPRGEYQGQTNQPSCRKCTPWYSTASVGAESLEECCAPYALSIVDKRGSFFVTASSVQARTYDCAAEPCDENNAWANGDPAHVCKDLLIAIRPTAAWIKFSIPNTAESRNSSHRISVSAMMVASDVVEIPEFRNRSQVLASDVVINADQVDRSGDVSLSLDNLYGGVSFSSARVLESRYLAMAGSIEAQRRIYACEYQDPSCEADYTARKAVMDDLTGSDFITESLETVSLGLHVHIDTRQFRASEVVIVDYESKAQDALCPTGTFSTSGTPPCRACTAGTFAPVVGHSACLACPTGTFSNQSASTTCHLCPRGTSTRSRGNQNGNSSYCLPYCPAGFFSPTGLAPCTPCPAETVSSRIGATSCTPCPSGTTTYGTPDRAPNPLMPSSSALGWTGVDRLSCMMRATEFGFEQIASSGQKFFMTVAWRVPDSEADVGDIIAIMYGNGWDSYRQLGWSYTSAGGSDIDATCNDQFDNGCRTQGSAPIPWASRKFTISSAGMPRGPAQASHPPLTRVEELPGAGEYAAVFFSAKRQRRLFIDTWRCSYGQVMDENGRPAPCPPDNGEWITDSGLRSCAAGSISPNRVPPCTSCPSGTANAVNAGTSCEACKRGTFAEAGSTACTVCPFGYSTEESGASRCFSCAQLIFENPDTTAPGCNETGALAGVVDFTTIPGQTAAPRVPCSNRLIDRGEECDDGNRNSDDGCSGACTVEDLFVCTRLNSITPDICTYTCGNGIYEPNAKEGCDDGNFDPFDGCSPSCQVETGWGCRAAADAFGGSFCWILPTCGNGLRQWNVPIDGEGCDDGNLEDGDGCSSTCVVEKDHTCVNASFGSDVCCADLVLCGDGIQQICEQCDDDNLVRYDGCSDTCRLEALSRCEASCSGPACSIEDTGKDKCPEHAVGQARSDPSLAIWEWMGLAGSLDGEFLPPEDDASGRLGLSNSAVLFLEFLGGPPGAEATGFSHVISAIKNDQSDVFRSLYSWDRESPTFLDCPHCHDQQTFHWPNGSISESAGAFPTDRSCRFLLTSGGTFVRGITRGIILFVDYLDLRHNESLVIGDTIGSERFVLTRGSEFPLEIHLVGNVEIQVELKSFFNDNRGWAPMEEGAMRFAIRYFGLLLGSQTFACTSLCLGKSECIKTQDCFSRDATYIWPTDLALGVDDPFRRRSEDSAWAGTRSHPLGDSAPIARMYRGSPATIMPRSDRISHTAPMRLDRSVEAFTPMRKLKQLDALPTVEELFVALQGIPGEDQDLPCRLAQFQNSVLLEFEHKKRPLGIDGIWDGRCAEQQSCSHATNTNNNDPCIPDDEYLLPARSCRVKWVVNHLSVREHRYGCGEAGSGNGVSEGVFLDVLDGAKDVLRNPDTDAPLFWFQRFQVAWTWSNSGRELGLSTAIYSFGNSPTVHRGELQVLMNEPGNSLYPSPSLERGFEEMLNAPGKCRRMTMQQLNSETAALQAADTVLGDLDQLDDFFKYKECNDSFVPMRELARSSAACTALWDLYVARDALSDFTNETAVLEAACVNPCFSDFQQSARQVAARCKGSWASRHFTENYVGYTFKKLFIAATTVFWMEVSCYKNSLDLPCIRSPKAFPSVFNNTCPAYNPGGLLLGPAFNFTEQCRDGEDGCTDALVLYQRFDDCCADTFATAQQEWADWFSTANRDPTYRIDLGETRDPWTDLGDGSNAIAVNIEQKAQACDRTPQDANCAMTSSCYSRNWRPKCCRIACRNQGNKKHSGSCFCACPITNVGIECLGRSAHVRATLLFTNENLVTFQYIHELWTLEGLAVGLSLPVSSFERDAIDEVTGFRRADGLNGSSLPVSLTFAIRILTASDREAQRLAVLLYEAFQQGTMQSTIHQQSSIPPIWTPQISLLGIPVSYSVDGAEMCDGVLIKCPEQDRGIRDVEDLGLGDDSGGGLSTAALGAIIGCLVALCLGGCLTFWLLWSYGIIKFSDKKRKSRMSHVLVIPAWVKNRDLNFATKYFRKARGKEEARPIVFRGDPFKSVKPFSKTAMVATRRDWNQVFENTRPVEKNEKLSSFVANGSIITNVQNVDRDKAIKVSRQDSEVVVDSALVADLGAGQGLSHVHIPIVGERDALMSKLFEDGPPQNREVRLPSTVDGMASLNAEKIKHGLVTSLHKKGKIDRTINSLVQLDRGCVSDRGLLHVDLPPPTMLMPRDNTLVPTDPLRQGQESQTNTSIRQPPSISAIERHNPGSTPRGIRDPQLSYQLEASYPLGPPSSTIIGDATPR